MTFKVIGHRGLGPTHNLPVAEQESCLYPENSLSAFKKVLADGADGIEFDIALSADSVPMVIHDEELYKHVAAPLPDDEKLLTTNYTAEDLKSFDIGNGETIPTLEEVLQLGLNENKNCFFNIDLKGKDTATAVYGVLKPYLDSGELNYKNVLMCSYDWELLRHLRNMDDQLNLAPCLKTKFLFGNDGVAMPGYRPIVDYYTPQATSVLYDFHQEIRCSAFDCVLTDLKDDLINLAIENKIGLMFSTGNDRVDANSTDYSTLQKLVETSKNLPFVIYKADEPTEVKKALKI